MNPIKFPLPIVITIIGLASSVSFTAGKYYTKVEHNTTNQEVLKKSLNDISLENKKLWQYILENNNGKLQANIRKEVLD